MEKSSKDRGARKETLDGFTKKFNEDKKKNDDFKLQY